MVARMCAAVTVNAKLMRPMLEHGSGHCGGSIVETVLAWRHGRYL